MEGLARFGTDVMRADDDRVRLRVAGDQVIPDIVRWLVERNAQVYGVHAHRKSLEEWFVEVMGEDQRPG